MADTVSQNDAGEGIRPKGLSGPLFPDIGVVAFVPEGGAEPGLGCHGTRCLPVCRSIFMSGGRSLPGGVDVSFPVKETYHRRTSGG